jgi:hypothetical protein
MSAYDLLARTAPQASIFCQRWWLDAVAPGQWRILQAQHGDKLLAAWPIVLQDNESELPDVVMPRLTQKLGILFAPTKMKYAEEISRHQRLGKELIEQLPPFRRFMHSFHQNFTNWLPFFWKEFGQTTRYTYLLENLQDSEKLWAEMRTSARTQVRKAIRLGLTLDDNLDLDTFLRLNTKTFARQEKEVPYPEDMVRRIDAGCVEHAGRLIVGARGADGRLHGALYITQFNGVAYYMMGGFDAALRSSGVASFLLWETAKRLGAEGYRHLDFEGSMMPNVEPSFRAIGARQTPYFMIQKGY